MLSSLRIGDLTSVLPVPKIPVVPAALITGGTSGIGLAIARATPGLGAYGDTKATVIHFTHTINRELDADGVRAVALCPAFVDTPMAEWSGIPGDEMIRPEDCAEIVRMLLRLSPRARVPQVVIERVGDGWAGCRP
jgi:NAD(P)-dependent dehydrogenase (short-subunit alcohol dehydrogenase family)